MKKWSAAIFSLLLIVTLLSPVLGCQPAPVTVTQTNTTTLPAKTATATSSATTTLAAVTSTATTTATLTRTTTATSTTTTPVVVSKTTSTTVTAATQSIADMYGTKLTVPAKINRVLSTGPVETQLIYILAPDKLCGLSSVWDGSPSLIPSTYAGIPVIGNASNGSFNFEAALATKPDVVLEGKTKNLDLDRANFGTVPVVGVNAGDSLLWDYEAEITYVGNLLGVPDKASALVKYYKEAMSYVTGIVSAIPDSQKVKVYYAEGNDGLQTDASGSWHCNLLTYCGGINVASVQVNNTSQAVNVSMEQVLNWNASPGIDMIIIGRGSQTTTYGAITAANSLWQSLACVTAGKVYVRPDNPTSWFDGPPGYGQIAGMYWMVNKLYPARTTGLDLNVKIKEFYSSFLHYNLTDTELASLLANPK
jgi:iron complex transport system substrate-binding protein